MHREKSAGLILDEYDYVWQSHIGRLAKQILGKRSEPGGRELYYNNK